MAEKQTPYPPQDRMRQARTFPGLTPAERCLLFILADYVNSRTGKCWPGIELLAKDMGIGRCHVSRYIKRLEAKGALVASRTPGERNVYFMNMEPMSELTRPRTKRTARGMSEWIGGACQNGHGGHVQMDTGVMSKWTPEQSIDPRKKKRKGTENVISSSFSSGEGDKDGKEETKDKRVDMAKLYHNLSAEMPSALRQPKSKAPPAKSEYRIRMEELMGSGVPYLTAVEMIEKEQATESLPPTLPAHIPEQGVTTTHQNADGA